MGCQYVGREVGSIVWLDDDFDVKEDLDLSLSDKVSLPKRNLYGLRIDLLVLDELVSIVEEGMCTTGVIQDRFNLRVTQLGDFAAQYGVTLGHTGLRWSEKKLIKPRRRFV